jgi:hypothetical protein
MACNASCTCFDREELMRQSRTLDLASMYMNQPVLGAHGIALQLEESRRGHMKGHIRLDPNTCSLDLWGDPDGCTKMAPRSRPVEATMMRTLDAHGHHRVHWALEIQGIENEKVSLIEYPAAHLWYLSIATGSDGTSVVPMLIATLLASDATGHRPTQPDGDIAGSHEVTEYHLQGDGMQIVFHRGNDEDMKLVYNGKEFSGRPLHRETTVLGLVASVVLEASPDRDTTWLTVVVPAARCPSNARSVAVTTFAVVTTKRTSIMGPELVSGQLDVYKVVSPLSGNAW